MCGIFGAIGSNIISSEMRHVEWLGLLNQERGTDSTGVFLVSGLNTAVIKKLLPSSAFFYISAAWNSALQEAKSFQVVIGHTRSKTIGENTEDLAHPHTSGSIVGVHNGTVDSFRSEAIENKTSDSYILFKYINEIGLEATLDKLNSNDALAIVYYDKKTRTINVYRNDRRPLHYMISSGVLYFSSEAKALEYKKPYKFTSQNAHSTASIPVHSFETNKLYTFNLGTTSFSVKEMQPLKHKPNVSANNYKSNYDSIDWRSDDYWKNKQKDKQTTTGSSVPVTGRVIDITKKGGSIKKAEGLLDFSKARFIRSANKVNVYSIPLKTQGIYKNVNIHKNIDVLGGYLLPLHVHERPEKFISCSSGGSSTKKQTTIDNSSGLTKYKELLYTGYKGYKHGRNIIDKMFPSQCCNCGDTVTEHDTVYWTAHDTFYCQDCFGEIPDYIERYPSKLEEEEIEA